MRSQAFTTGSNRYGYELSGVAVGKYYKGATRIELSIYSVDTNGHPETLLFAFTNPDSYTNDTQAFNAPAGATLDPGATYAVVVQHATSGDDLNLYTTASDNEDDESLDGWSIADAFHYESGGSWQAEPDGKALKIIIRGIAKVGPSLAPTGLTATAVGRDRIDLSWTAPIDDGGSAITGYRIESSADGSAGWADLVANTGSAATIYSHTGLMPNTTLHYRVSAINGEGTSDPSGAANTTTENDVMVNFDPDTVTREVNENTGANQNVGSPVTATYTGTCTLTYALGGADDDSFEIDSSTGQIKTRSGVTYDHEAKSTYTVTVTAYHANCGADDATVTINVNDVNEPPRVPLEVVAHAVPRIYDQLFARWTPPENAGRPDITGYDIQYGQGSQFFGFSWRDGPQNVDGTSATISGLSPYSLYHVRVRAKNDEGSGPWSEPYFTTTNVLDFEVETSLPFIPDGLVPGDRFHLLFVTPPAQALKTILDDYYNLAASPVITLPETNPFQRYWRFFYPVASIRHIDARVITNTTYTNEDKGAPVYWVGGGKAADDYEDFYDGDWDDESARNVRGEPVPLPDGVWTGSTADGRELMDGGTSRAAGESRVGYGAPGSTVTGEGPIYTGPTAANTERKPIFSMSTVFRVVNPALATNEGQMSDTDDRRSAMRSQTFTTGSNRYGYELSGVALGKSYRETTRIELSIYSVDANGHPDTLLFACTNLDSYTTHTQAYNAPAGATLDPGATYAVVVQPATSGDDLNLYTTASDNEDDESLDGWSIADAFHYESGGSWQAEPDGKALKIIIRGIAKVGPSLAPTGLTATAVGRDRIDLSWTAPIDGGGSAITGYRIESSADGSAGWADLVADTGSAATIYSHTGLMPNTTLHYRVSAINGEGASDSSGAANATTADYPAVTVSFEQAAYTVAEGETQSVTVTLNADPERTVVIPIVATPQGATTTDDYSVAPTSVTFDAGDMSKTITFTATQDNLDDGESVKLTFGMLPSRVSAGTTATTTVSITDDDTPPTAANGTVTTDEDTDHTFAADEFGYADADGDALAHVKIIELPAAGTGALTLNGTAITSVVLPQTVTAAELTGGGLKYAPPANANGTGYASFKFKVNDGTADSAEYTITINVTAVNDPATGTPTISGTAQVGQTLTASTAGIVDPDGVPSVFTYQWKRYAADRITFEANIGTDSMTYTLTASEEGKKVLVEVSFTDNGGSSEGPLVSALYPSTQSQTVNPNNRPTALDGTVTTVEDTAHTFAAANFSYSDTDSDPLASVKIIELPAVGTGALTLNGTAITSADLPKTVTATELTENKLTYSPPANANGTGYASFKFKVNDGTEDSSSEYFITIDVSPVNDPATGAPTIRGTAQVGQTLTASTAGIDDVDGLPSVFTYQWKRYAADRITFEANIGTDSMTYTLTAAEEGKKVLVEVSFTDNGGSSEGPLVSALYPSTQSQTVNPNNRPTALDGTVTTVEDTAHTFAAANFSYSDTDSDPLASVKIIELPAVGTGALTLNGTAITSDDLPKTVTATELTENKLTYSPPANANGTGYASFKFKVNDGTEDSSSEYFMTINVTAVNDPATGAPTISGTAHVGLTLTASTAGIDDVDGLPSAFTYQWKRVDADGTSNPTDIGADSSAYTLTAAEEGKKVLVEVSFTDNGGSSEGPLVSAAYPSSGTVVNLTVSFGETTYEVVEGETVTVAVTLSADPERTVAIPITATPQDSASSADYTVPTSVTFNAGDMSKTITFTAAQDAEDDDGESVLLAFGILPDGVSPGTRNETTVSITDDDEAGVTIEPTALSVVAGRSNEYTVKLATEPTGDVTVTVSGHASTDVTPDKTTLTFTVDNWDTAQTVTVSATQNAATGKVTLAHAVSGADYGSVTAEPVVVSVVGRAGQQPTLQVGVSSSTQTLTVPEGGANSYTLVLGSRPTGDVTVGVTLPAGTDLSLDKTSLTFTLDNWDDAQTVTVTAEEDDDGVTDAGVTLTHTVSGGGYGSTTVPGVEVSITENDTAGVVISKDSLTVGEGDAAGSSYTVKLATEPSGSVSVSITGQASTDLSLSGATLISDTLTFTVDDWNVAQTVTVKAGEDDDGANDTATLTHTASGGDYASVSNTLPVTVTDDDEAAVTIEPTALSVVTGRTNKYSVKLATKPTGDVTVTISGHASTDVTPDNTTLTFTVGNWSMAQTVTVSAAENAATGKVTLAHAVSGADYGSVSADSVVVSVVAVAGQRRGEPTLQVGVSSSTQTLTVPEGGSNSYALILSSRPTGDVAIGVTLPAGSDLTLSSDMLTFTVDNWDVAQTVTVTAEEDDDGVTDAAVTLTHTISGGGYGSTTVPDVEVSISENDTVGVTIEPAALSVVAGRSNEYTVALATEPTGEVTVTISGHASTDVTLDKTTLTFTVGNWSMAQTVTVSAAQSASTGKVTLAHAVSGADYGSVTAEPVVVSVVGRAGQQPTLQVGVSSSTQTLTVPEGGANSYTLVLGSRPTGDVTVGVTLPAGTDLSLDKTSLTFTMDNWDDAQTVAVTAAEDDDAVTDAGVTLTHTVSGGGYGSTTVPGVEVSITENDTAGVVISKDSLTVGEGDAAGTSYTVALATEPSGSVSVSITGQASTDLSLSGATLISDTLTFTVDDWNVAQTVTVKAGEDDDGANDTATLTHTASGGDYANITVDLPVTVTDDDMAGMTVQFGADAYTVSEGSTATITVTLSADPQSTVVIPLVTTDQGGAVPADYSVPPSVMFNTGEMSKTFDFTAMADDASDTGESVLLGFGTNLPGGVSAGTTAATTVTITDDDEPQGQEPGNVGRRGTVVTIERVPDGTVIPDHSSLWVGATVEDGSTFIEGTQALFRLKFEAVGGGPPVGTGVDVDLRFSWQIPSPLVTTHGQVGSASFSLHRVDVWDTAVWIHDNDVGHPDGTLTIRIIGCERSDCMIGTPSQITLTIADDDGGPEAAIPGPPDLPSLVCARSGDGYDDTGIAVSWKAPNFVGGAPVESYELRYRQSSRFVWGTLIEHPWESWPHGVAATSATLTGLVTRANYTVEVRAVSAIGPGQWSEPNYFRVGPTDEVCEIIDQLTPQPLNPPQPDSARQSLSNAPAQGEPRIDGIPEVGQTLSADTTAIADANGFDEGFFQYQWLAEDADIAGATSGTYTVAPGDVGKAIMVRVAFTDDARHEETLTSAPTAVVTAAGLQLQSATVDGATLTLTYNEALDTGVTLGTTPFAVNVNGSSRSLIGVGVGESNVLLLLSSAVEAGDTVTVDYTAPDGPDFIRGTQGRKAASFSGQAVTNNTASAPDETASAPLTASAHDAPASHNGQDAFTFELRFSEEPKSDFSYTTVQDHAFTVTGGSVTYVRRLNPPSNIRWEITVTPGSGADVTIALNATTDCSAQGAICTEEGGKLSGGLLLVVPGPNAPATPNTPATDAPTISGTARVGETLTADTTGISDGDGLDNATFAYQWLADDAEINGATAATYTLAGDDAGKASSVKVSFTDDAGNDEQLTSAVTGAVAAAPPPPNTPATGAPTISGTARVGETLTADTTGIADDDGLSNAAFAYQWLDDDEINGATASTYTLADADEGKAIKVRVSFADDVDNDEELTSAATGEVAAAEASAAAGWRRRR